MKQNRMKWTRVSRDRWNLTRDSRITITYIDNICAICYGGVLLDTFDTLPEAKDRVKEFYWGVRKRNKMMWLKKGEIHSLQENSAYTIEKRKCFDTYDFRVGGIYKGDNPTLAGAKRTAELYFYCRTKSNWEDTHNE